MTNMSKQNQTPPARACSIPLPPEGFKPTTNRSHTGSASEVPPNCIEFYDDDDGYRAWLSANPEGWFMNNYRVHDGPVPAHKQDMENALTILHVTEKAHVLKRSSTTRYRKLCSAEKEPLEDFKRTIIVRTIGM